MRFLLGPLLLSACISGDPDLADTPTTVANQPRTVFDRLGDTAGPVPGLPALTYVRTPDATRCGGVAVTVRRNAAMLVRPEDQPMVDMFSLTFPTGLDFIAEKAGSMSRFEAFLSDITTRGGTATKHYQAQAESGDVTTKVIATARLGQISRYVASTIARASIPADVAAPQIVDGYDLAADKISAYCDALAQHAEPLLDRADAASTSCGELAAKLPRGWWSSVCVRLTSSP